MGFYGLQEAPGEVSRSYLSRAELVVACFILFAVALVVRLPYMILFPVFRFDELAEDLLGYWFIQGKVFPLTNTAWFIGALFNYLAGIAFKLVGSYVAFRALSAVFGALTAPLVFLLALKLRQDFTVAALSALVLAFSPPHILVASHVGWSASLTPFFVVAAAIAALKALEAGSRRYWLLTGLVAGLAVQTHPSAIASLAGLAAAYALWRGLRETIKLLIKRAPMMAAGFCLGYLNMIVFNVVVPLGSVFYVLKAPWTGVGAEPLTPLVLVRRFAFIVFELYTSLPMGIPVIPIKYLASNLLFYVYTAVLIAVMTYGVLKDKLVRALGVLLLVSILLLSVGTSGRMNLDIFGFAWGPHYIQQLIPFLSIALAASITLAHRRLKESRVPRKAAHAAVIAVIALTVAWPFMNLLLVYAWVSQHECTNAPLIISVEAISTKLNGSKIYVEAGRNDPVLITYYSLLTFKGLNVWPPMQDLANKTKTPLQNYLNFIKTLKPNEVTLLIARPNSPVDQEITRMASTGELTIIKTTDINLCTAYHLAKIYVAVKTP